MGNETNTGNSFNKQKCSMIPVSSESYGKFILNCNNQWMKTNNLIIKHGPIYQTVSISGLNYTPLDSSWVVRYSDITLLNDVLDPNYFVIPNEAIYINYLAPKIEDFHLNKMYENQG
ncbi:MAG: hypothetical protein LW807_03330 [Proteobacteria bacterium]|jgi:hypothetical protein|nr:hypothetical protein [Pseudomonadota bacterium]